MAFNVGDVVKKTDGTQKYKVTEVLAESKYQVQLEPLVNKTLRFTFKESELESA